ncbi:MAG: lipopolysaccharide biosynthesis protein [Hyphomicrobiales bacterium]|nr:lipopolysaccharide biosynthesis protein [Hyphomicrobiales bacterium]
MAAAAQIDLGALGGALWRRKLLIGGLTLLAGAIAFAAVNLITPRYKSEARVLIETRENIFLRPDADKNMERGSTVDQEAVTSQVQLILSRDLAREVIKQLKLAERPEFDPVLAGPSLVRTLLSFTGIIKDPMEMTPEERVLKSYYDRLSVFQVEKSRVIAIEFESQDPELAANVANTIAERYQVLQQTAKQDQTRAAGNWLAGEIERLRTRVADAEAKVEQYRAKTNLFIGNNNTTLSNQQLGDFNAQLAAARAQKADSEVKTRLIREALKAGTTIEFSEIVNSELMRRLSEQRITLRAQLAEQSSTLLSQHPRIKELRAQIADLESQMRGEAERLARSLENDAKVASAKVDALSSGLDQLKRQAASTNEQDVQLRALEREAKSQRDLLESYLAKFREASARDSIGAAAPEARIISSATVSTTPSWPKKVPTVLVATLAMLVLSSGFVLSGELLRTLPRRPLTASEPIVETAADPARDLRIIGRLMGEARGPAKLTKDAVDELATELIASGEGARRVVVGSAGRVRSKALALARSLARTSRVVLVGMVPDQHQLADMTTDPQAPGLAELVEGAASFGEVIARDRESRPHVVSSGRVPLDMATVSVAPRFVVAIEALARSYDHVVLDAGAVGDASLAPLAALAPRAVLVVGDLEGVAIGLARDHLQQAGFTEISVLGAEAGSEGEAPQQAAA